jgi:hypothetical protein
MILLPVGMLEIAAIIDTQFNIVISIASAHFCRRHLDHLIHLIGRRPLLNCKLCAIVFLFSILFIFSPPFSPHLPFPPPYFSVGEEMAGRGTAGHLVITLFMSSIRSQEGC